MAWPLAKLIERIQVFIWTEEQQKTWEELKKRLTTPLILSYPDLDAEFILDTDANDFGIGTVLSQNIKGQNRSLNMAVEC